MRDAITTALEVAGLICAAVALGVATTAWAGFLAAGACLFVAGVVEGRR